MEPRTNVMSLSPKERMRYFAKLSGDTGLARAKIVQAQAELAAAALLVGVELLDVENDRLHWRGNALETVLAERIATGEELDDDEDEEGGDPIDAAATEEADAPWAVHVEADLLQRMRATDFDLTELLDQHQRDQVDPGGVIVATIGWLSPEDAVAVMTVLEVTVHTEATIVFSINRTA